MTPDLLRSRIVARLTEQRAETLGKLRRCKPRAPLVMDQGTIAATTAEEIALFAVDTNATVDALEQAIAIVQEEYKRLVSPEQPGDEASGKDAAKGKERHYG